jgi:hypothetical protein
MGLKVKDPNGEWRSTGGGGGSKPNLPLQFTGAVEAIYDGSEAVTVEIPEGGGDSNLLFVTLKTENGNYVSSHTYQEIKEFTDNGGDVVLCEKGTFASFFPLVSVSSTQAFFGKQAFLGQLFVSQGYNINADGTVTLDQQMIEIPSKSSIPSDEHINGLIDEYLSEALGGDY